MRCPTTHPGGVGIREAVILPWPTEVFVFYHIPLTESFSIHWPRGRDQNQPQGCGKQGQRCDFLSITRVNPAKQNPSFQGIARGNIRLYAAVEADVTVARDF